MSLQHSGTNPFEVSEAVAELAAQPGMPSGGTLTQAMVPKLLAVVRTALEANRSFVVRTSGSTGGPKRVLLSTPALRASSDATHEVLGGTGQWLLALSPQVIAGVQVLVRSVFAQTEPIVLTGRFDERAFIAAAQQLTAPRRYTSLVPVQLSRLLDLAEHSPEAQQVLARFDAILVGGQALASAEVQRAEALRLALVRTYGGTETAGGCVYDGVPIGDTRIRVVDGEVWLSGSCLADGYLDDAQLTIERFSTDEESRWFHTRDTGTLEHGRLTVTGRLDSVLNSGGVKVSLDALERFVQQLAGWRDAVVVAVADETWGERAVLVVTEAAGGETAREQTAVHAGSNARAGAINFEAVQEAVRAELGVAAVPVRLETVLEIPLLASGKPDKISLGKLFSKKIL